MLSRIELMALPRQFGFLTAVLDPADVLPGVHVRSGEGHTIGQQFVILRTAKGRMVIAGDCLHGARNLTRTNNDGMYIPLGSGIGSVWDQLKFLDRIDRKIAADLGRLFILREFERWRRFASAPARPRRSCPCYWRVPGRRIRRATGRIGRVRQEAAACAFRSPAVTAPHR